MTCINLESIHGSLSKIFVLDNYPFNLVKSSFNRSDLVIYILARGLARGCQPRGSSVLQTFDFRLVLFRTTVRISR